MKAQFEDKPAVREATPLLVGLIGPSTSGKTVSALRLACGIQRVTPGEIFIVDTEGRRALHYAPKDGEEVNPSDLKFQFRHVEFPSPFGPDRYLEAVNHCYNKGARIVIVDSMSHEHEGVGGVLEMHEQEQTRLAAEWKKSLDAVSFAAWKEPKKQRRALINALLQMPISFIFCFRAKEKTKPGKEKNENGREVNALLRLGWMPIAGEEFIYEMTLSLILPPQSGGMPILEPEKLTDAQRMMFKIPGQFKKLFKTPQALSENIGEQLALWATGGVRLGPVDQQARQQAQAMIPKKVEAETGPDKSEPCKECTGHRPRCEGLTLQGKACGIEMMWRSEFVHAQYGLLKALWRCPNKCKSPKDKRKSTNIDAADWHAILMHRLHGAASQQPQVQEEPGANG